MPGSSKRRRRTRGQRVTDADNVLRLAQRCRDREREPSRGRQEEDLTCRIKKERVQENG